MNFPIERSYIYTDNNKVKILCLVMELCKPTDKPIFTVRDQKEGYESLRTLFVNLTVNDPSEATFAETVFGDVGYWLKARENTKLKPFLEDWRQEADVKRKSLAFQAVMDEVRNNGKSAFSAAKFLIDEPHKDKRNQETKLRSKASTEEAKESVRHSFQEIDLSDYVN